MKHLTKRIIDILLSIICIILFSPIILLIAILVYINMGSPVIFKQLRPGLHGKPFYIYKFRTMKDLRDENGNLLPDEQRLTRFGAFLRSTSLDELPELINVLKGDMSLVGPRPEVPKYVDLYTEEERKVLEVRPGITDLASLRYSDENEILGKVENPEEYYINVIMKDKLKLNLEYIEKSNIIFDIYLIIKTIIKCI